MSRVVAIREDHGTISEFKLDDGRVLNRQQICDAATRGEIEGVSTFETRDGGEAVRSDRGQWDYSLKSLPRF